MIVVVVIVMRVLLDYLCFYKFDKLFLLVNFMSVYGFGNVEIYREKWRKGIVICEI